MAEDAGAAVIPAAGCKELLDAAILDERARHVDRDDGNLAPEPAAHCSAWAVGHTSGRALRVPMNIQQPTLVVSGNHDVIVYTVNSLYLVQNMPNAKLILYPDANHGSWYENHEDFVFETNRFLNASGVIAPVVTNAAAY